MKTEVAHYRDMTKNERIQIGDRVAPYGARDEVGTVIGIGFAFGVPQVQVRFDREGLNHGCEGPQAGQWLDEADVTVVAPGNLVFAGGRPVDSQAPQLDEEPDIDDAVHCCPDCERPNQFGELCESCRSDREAEIAENREEGL
jgi:hypothetical protein